MDSPPQSSYPKFVYLENGGVCRELMRGSSFRVVSYNILAQVYVKSSLFPHSPPRCLKWKVRSEAIINVLKSLRADFLCLQEMDEYDTFYRSQMEQYGYASVYVQRTGQKCDGCGIFYKKDRAEMLLKEDIRYNDLIQNFEGGKVLCGNGSYVTLHSKGMQKIKQRWSRDSNDFLLKLRRDCVGVMAAFKLAEPVDCLVIFANTHILWDPEWNDVKLAQVKYLLSRVAKFKELVVDEYRCTPSVVVAGDFNSTPGDEVYDYLVGGSSVESANRHDERPIALSSLYASLGREPVFTTRTPSFTGTLDYILFSSSGCLKPVSYLELPRLESGDISSILPNYSHPSDHLPIGADFRVIPG